MVTDLAVADRAATSPVPATDDAAAAVRLEQTPEEVDRDGRRAARQALLAHPYAPPPAEQHDVPWRDLQMVTRVVALAGIVAASVYLTWLYDRSHENVPVLWVLTIVAETIVVLHSIGIWLTLLSYRSDIGEPEEVAVLRRALLTGAHPTPTVDVFITHASEPLHLLLPTMVAAKEMLLPHRTWVLDDGRDPQVREACRRLGIGYLRRDTNAHAKAGNVNAAIARTHGEYVVVLDADHVPRPDLLVHTLPHLVANPAVAMVQTPQTYAYEGRGMVAEGAAISQELFYEALMPAKNQANAAFCVGTNVVFRRRALETLTTREKTWRERRRDRELAGTGVEPEPARTELGEHFPRGGIWIGSNSEDIWTSLELHRRGWRSVFVPKVLTQGLTPDSITGFLKQQFRWASGGWEILLWARVVREGRLTLSQKLQYLLVPSHYALSFAMCIFALLSPIYLLTDQSPIRSPFVDWAAHFVPFYVLTVAVPFVQAGRLRPSAIVVSLAAAPAHVRAFFATLLRRRAAWTVTNGRHGGFRLVSLAPQIGIVLLDIVALLVAWRLGGQNRTSVAIAVLWVAMQLAIVTYLLVGSELADRAARRRADEEPDDLGALALLDGYLDLRRRAVR